MSGFSSLNVAARALAAQQRAIDVTGQNVANANTRGYTRQRVEMQSLASVSAYGLQSREDSTGNGVSAEKVIRVRDAFLELRAQQEVGNAARAAATAATYDQLETSSGEPGSTGVQSLLSAVSTAWSQLSTRPTDTSSRIAVLSSADALAKGLRTVSASVDRQWTNTLGATTDVVAEANATLAQIADLNKSIRDAQLTGNPANELQDQRDVLVATLAQSLGATSVDTTDGMVDVVVDGTSLVSGTGASKLALRGATDPTAATTDPVRLAVVPGGSVLRVGGGVAGRIDALNVVLPGYQAQLDTVADLVQDVNDVLATGYDQAGSTPGAPLFAGTSARDIAVVMTDPARLAVAANPPLVVGTRTDPSADGAVADRIAQLGKTPTGPDATYRQMITGLGIASRSAASASATASTVLGQVDADRLSVSGVSLDEEMTNLVVFKQSYAAAARVVTALDEMLDVLINRTGLVGR
ncbi:flagellar hook-associated protein 1 FlgK [Klenkia marina]|uniref:Flagellar hook-associated protein 1 n=1 Tax=Klenkia marina TaxID=1960309 RepID=A0A1G4XBL9_9ACTN|nr:flagellar hook-associated protein FlgK [Klenkia marina]SCX38334.1 flagellar hook-associated protein 1 FlgK [Klenkia marina]